MSQSPLPKMEKYQFPVLPFVLFCVAMALVFSGFDYIKTTQLHDETYHVPTTLDFRDMVVGKIPATLDYDNSLGPVVYTLYGAWSVLSDRLAFMRIPSLILCMGTCYILMRWLKVRRTEVAFFFSAICAGPWFFLSAFTLHGEQLTIFLTCSTLAGLIPICFDDLRNENSFLLIVSIVTASLIPLSKIYSIFVLPAIFLTLLLINRKDYRIPLLLCLAAIPCLLLWWHWGGVTPPAFRNGSWGQSGQKLSFEWSRTLRPLQLFAYCGFYFIPFLFTKPTLLEKLSRKALIAWFVTGLLVAAIIPLGMAGPIDSILAKLLRLPNEIPFVSASERAFPAKLLYGIGLSVFLALLHIITKLPLHREPLINVCIFSLAIYACLFPFTGVLFVERYAYPAYLFVFLIGWRLTRDAIRSWWPFLPFILIGLAHAFYKQSSS